MDILSILQKKYDAALATIEEKDRQIEELILPVLTATWFVYHFFCPKTLRSIYTGLGATESEIWRDQMTILQAFGQRRQQFDNETLKIVAIKKAVDGGGVCILKLAIEQSHAEAQGIEYAVILTHLGTGISANKIGGSANGSFKDLSIREFKKRGQAILDAALRKLQNDGKQIYTAKNFNDYLTLHGKKASSSRAKTKSSG